VIVLPALKAIPWRLIGAVAGVAAVSFAGWRVNTWHTAYGELRATQARLEAEEECGEGSKCAARVAAAETAAAARNVEAVTQYEQEIARLNARPVERRIIRVCAPGGAVRDAPRPGEPPRPEAGGVLRTETEFDTSPLRELAREADRQVAAYRALRERDEALAAD
jgi:hypothetical protein